MRKQRAIEMLGGTHQSAAACVGVVKAAVHQWPDPLNPVTRDRVLAGILRMHVARAMGLTMSEFHDNKQAQAALEEALVASPQCLLLIGLHAADDFKKTALAAAG